MKLQSTQNFLETFRKMEHQRDLISYDGPLLSEFKTADGDRFLMLWCDQNEVVNRWLAFPVRQLHLSRYLAGKVTLRDLVLETGPTTFLVDIDADFKPVQAKLLASAKVPEDYLPSADSTFPGAEERDK